MATGRVPTTANSPLTAKGDLFSFSTAPARLAVGSNGETLVANSSTSTGLGWTATPNATNPVINSAFEIWQRGTSVALAASTSTANSYTADRFQMPTNANQACTVSRQATGDTTNLPNIQYAARFQRNSGQTGTGNLNPSYNLETADSIPFAGKIITFSFFARAGANFSQASNALGVAMVRGTGTDQNLQNGYTGQSTAISSSATLTTTWQRFTYTTGSAISSNTTQLGFFFPWTPVGTAGANDYFEITGIMINVGSVALPYRRNAGTIQGELAACQRYYFRTSNDSAFAQFAAGVAASSTDFTAYLQMPVTMRVAPTAVEFSNLRSIDGPNDYGAPSSVTINTFLNNRNIGAFTVVDTGYTQFRPMFLQANNNAAAHLAVTAEL